MEFKIDFWGALILILVTLKLIGQITLSWWWIAFIAVFPLIILAVCFGFYLLSLLVIELLKR